MTREQHENTWGEIDGLIGQLVAAVATVSEVVEQLAEGVDETERRQIAARMRQIRSGLDETLRAMGRKAGVSPEEQHHPPDADDAV